MYKFNGLYFRAVEEKDLERLRLLRNAQETWANLTDITLLTEPAQLAWFESLNGDKTRRYFSVCEWRREAEHELVGVVRMDEIDLVNRSARVGCDVVYERRGKGIGTAIMTAVVKYCFEEMNLHRIWLAVLETNTPAIKVYEKVGFKPEGKYTKAIYRNGKYVDYLLYSIIHE